MVSHRGTTKSRHGAPDGLIGHLHTKRNLQPAVGTYIKAGTPGPAIYTIGHDYSYHRGQLYEHYGGHDSPRVCHW